MRPRACGGEPGSPTTTTTTTQPTTTTTTTSTTSTTLPPAQRFSDISSSPYKTAIESLAQAGVIGGYPDRTFRPDSPVLRAQFAKMAVLSLGLPVTEGGTPLPFTDVEKPAGNLYPDDYVAVAAARGLVNGIGGGRFQPYVDIGRAQLLTIVVRAAQRFKPAALQEPPSGWQGVLPASDATHGANSPVPSTAHCSTASTSAASPSGTRPAAKVAQVLWNLREKRARAKRVSIQHDVLTMSVCGSEGVAIPPE